MSRRRKVSTTISTDKLVNQLAREAGDFAALLYTWMIPHGEDSASITGDTEELLMTVVPGMRHHTEEDIREAVEAMDRLGLVAWDREAAVVYFDSESFYRHQSYIPEAKRADNSAHFQKRHTTAPNSEEQRESAQKAASLSPSPSPSPSRSKSLVVSTTTEPDTFPDFWRPYPNKQGKRDAQALWRRLGKGDRDRATLAASAMAFAVQHAYQEARFCPHGDRFLRKRLWEAWFDDDTGAMVVPPGYEADANGKLAAQIARIDTLADDIEWPEEEP